MNYAKEKHENLLTLSSKRFTFMTMFMMFRDGIKDLPDCFTFVEM